MTALLRIVRRVFSAAAVFLALAGPVLAEDETARSEAGVPDVGSRIARAVAFDGRLWLMGGARQMPGQSWALVSYDLAKGTRVRAYSKGVAGLLAANGRLWILRQASEGNYVLEEWTGNTFTERAKFSASQRNPPLALTAVGSRPAVLQLKGLRVLEDQGWRELKAIPSPEKNFGWGLASTDTPADGSALYIGYDRGEWGGGMVRLDLKAGSLDEIESNAPAASGYAGGGTLLNGGLDPVNGIIPDPAHPDCVIPAVGLVHFESAGRILRVCGREVSLVFEKVHPYQYNGRTMTVSEAFFGLYPSKDGFWAISNSGVYKFGKTGEPEHIELPKLEDWHGLHISNAVPGILVMTTDVNWAMSVSGYTPLIVPLDEGDPNEPSSQKEK